MNEAPRYTATELLNRHLGWCDGVPRKGDTQQLADMVAHLSGVLTETLRLLAAQEQTILILKAEKSNDAQ